MSSRRLSPVVLALLTVALGVSPANGGDDAGPAAPAPAVALAEADAVALAALARPDDPGHAGALAEWAGLSARRRSERARAGLRSADPDVARFAAEVADPRGLDLAELRRALAFAAADPAWVADPWREMAEGVASSGLGFGRPEIVAMWRTAATTDGFAFVADARGDDTSHEFHRALDATLAVDLVPLLETRSDAVREHLEWDLRLVADVTTRDATRPAFARAFLWLLARERAAAAKEPPPALSSIEPPRDGPGVPEALKVLVRDAIERSVRWDAAANDAKPKRSGWSPWLVRFARDTTASARDVEFLAQVAKGARGLDELRAWAVRSLASLDPDGSRSGWPALADAGDEVAAAELARQGKPAALRAMADRPDGAGEAARIFSFEVDPARARERWLASLETASGPSDVLDLSPAGLAKHEEAWGVRVRDEDLRAIGRALFADGRPRRGCAWFFGAVLPEAITLEIAGAMAKRLRETTAAERDDGTAIDHADLRVTLAALDVRAPDVLRDLLLAWARDAAGGMRDEALVLLARLGDATLVPEMLASFAGEETHAAWSVEAAVLGRVKDARVEAFLRRRLEARPPDDPDGDDLAALAAFHGLPEAYAWVLTPGRKEDPLAEPYPTVRARLLAGDPRAAVEALVASGRGIDDLWQVEGPEALDALRRLRRERFVGEEPVYWDATHALAAAGDADARREWLGFLRDGRVRMNDGHEILLTGALATDPDALATTLDLLDANCCLGWQAHVGLLAGYPTAPVGNIGPNLGRNRTAAERWFARHRGTFAWSRLLDGYVPGPARK